MKSVGYETSSKVLEVEFESGAVYQYLDVPERVYKELTRAESKGRYFNQEILNEYEFVRLGTARRAAEG